ncbi:hypothetical protein MAIT1_01409 [Magnetofaba australis IT-1]|uniref:Uncharacterized protein n=1 Tax=Magnetofaba australis IT-1 TaxID=1434232 RepID=A0A1Y2K1D8_9PROT|nr:hypothetical protein MAIT1_01409 [Magnetofaba australis IT-1]
MIRSRRGACFARFGCAHDGILSLHKPMRRLLAEPKQFTAQGRMRSPLAAKTRGLMRRRNTLLRTLRSSRR